MHGRRSLWQNLSIQFGEKEKQNSQLANDKGKTRNLIIKETMEEEAKDGKDQHEPTLKELSAPFDYDAFTRILAPINKNIQYRIDATMMSFLPSFHGRFSVEPHEFLWEFTQFFSSYYFSGISQEAVKLMLFSFALKDLARELLNDKGKTLMTW